MFTVHPRDAMVIAQEHASRLRADAAGARRPGNLHARRVLAATLRFAANRLDATPLVHRPA